MARVGEDGGRRAGCRVSWRVEGVALAEGMCGSIALLEPLALGAFVVGPAALVLAAGLSDGCRALGSQRGQKS